MLVAGLTGYVAEAAVPRFVSKSGNVNSERNWSKGDENGDFMVDNDDYRQTYVQTGFTINHDVRKPMSDVRESKNEMVFSDPCERYGDYNDDRIVKAYSQCSMRFTERIFELNDMNDITAYVNSPW